MDLYRFFDKDDALLYVGISMSALQRASQHRATQGWWSLVARMEVEHLDVTRAEIAAMEREVIRNEHPRFNVAHSVSADVAKKANWTCSMCLAPITEGYVQVTNREGQWQCVCRRCDPGTEIYFIQVWDIADYDDIAIWTKHLLGKVWFDLDEWEAMLRQSCQIRQWYAAMLYGRDADRQKFWIHRQQFA